MSKMPHWSVAPPGQLYQGRGQGGEIRTWPENVAGNLVHLSDYVLPLQRVGQTACCGTGAGTGRGCDPYTRSTPSPSQGVPQPLVLQGQAQARSRVAQLLVLQRHPLAGLSRRPRRSPDLPSLPELGPSLLINYLRPHKAPGLIPVRFCLLRYPVVSATHLPSLTQSWGNLEAQLGSLTILHNPG